MRLNVLFQEQNDTIKFNAACPVDYYNVDFGEVQTITENDYNKLENKPIINSVVLQGALTDANTTYSTFTNLALGSAGYLADSPVYRYQLLFQMDDSTVTPLNNNSNATGTGKTMLTNVEFDPFGDIFYYATTTTVNANARVNGGYMCYAHGALDLRYTFNCGQTLTAYAPVYLKVSLQSNGKVKIADSTPWEQTLPSTNDGYYYIYLGRTYSTYQMTLEKDHPVFYHDGTNIREYIKPARRFVAILG